MDIGGRFDGDPVSSLYLSEGYPPILIKHTDLRHNDKDEQAYTHDEALFSLNNSYQRRIIRV